MLEVKQTGNVGSYKLVTPRGKTPVLNISLASNRKVGEREFVDWTSVKIWGERAQNLAPHIDKGIKLLITGRPEARAYKGNDGLAKAELVIHASDIEFLSSKREFEDSPEEGSKLPLESVA